MDALDAAKAPPFPLALLLPLTAVFLLLLLLMVRRAGSTAGSFRVVAIWLRVVSGAYHFMTFAPIVGGLSINALLSVATVTVGALVVSTRTFGQRWVMPIYALLIVMLISSGINSTVSGAIDLFFKWGYVIVLIAAAREAMIRTSQNRILGLIAYCYAPIFVLQFLSLGLGLGKDTEGANELSYIGGYNHEAAFSMMIVTFVLAIYLNTSISFTAKAGLILMGVFGIMLANYRTAIISVLPLLIGTFMFEGVSRFDRKSRGFIAVLAIPAALLVVVVIADSLAERFADLGILVFDGEKFIKPPREYLAEEQKVLSGRLFIWSYYIDGYIRGTDLQLLFGFGPNSWVGTFPKYAHNTVVSYLYELGALGLVSLLVIWATFIAGTFKVRDTLIRNNLLMAQAGFLLLNLATMPHWNIEGNILFAILQGTMLYQLSSTLKRANAANLRAGE